VSGPVTPRGIWFCALGILLVTAIGVWVAS
jgi:hypothetical protein